MKKFITKIFLFIVFTNVSFSAFELRGNSARSIIFGSGFVAIENDVWSMRFNPAGISSLASLQTSVSYSPQLFGLKELSTSSAASAFPSSLGTIGASVSNFGFDLYREISPTVSFAQQFDDFSFGVNFNYNMLSIQHYGNDATIGIDIGALAIVTENVSIGFSTMNINAPTIAKKKEKLPQTFLLGVAYRPKENILFTTGIEKDVRFKPSTTIGVEYFPIDELALRVGIQDEPSLFNAGFGIHYENFVFDYAASSHQILGLTHYITLTFGL